MIATVYREIERDLGNEDASLSVSFLEKLVRTQRKNYLMLRRRLNSLKLKIKCIPWMEM